MCANSARIRHMIEMAHIFIENRRGARAREREPRRQTRSKMMCSGLVIASTFVLNSPAQAIGRPIAAPACLGVRRLNGCARCVEQQHERPRLRPCDCGPPCKKVQSCARTGYGHPKEIPASSAARGVRCRSALAYWCDAAGFVGVCAAVKAVCAAIRVHAWRLGDV